MNATCVYSEADGATRLGWPSRADKRESTMKLNFTGTAISAVALTIGLAASAVSAQTPEEFYTGQTIRVMSTTGAGGTMDLYLLLMMKHAPKHLPEGAQLVLEHRPGGGLILGANHLFNNAPSDGTYMGMLCPCLGIQHFSRPDAVQFDPAEFISIGRFADLPRVFVARADSGIKTLQDATGDNVTHSILFPGDTFNQMQASLNETLGTTFRPVPGYQGGGAAFLAMEQGEVVSTSAEPGNLLVNKWHLVQDGTINVLAQYGLEPVAGLEDVPMVTDLVPVDHPLRPVVDVVAGTAAYGIALSFPPNVPEDRVAYMREALANILSDPELVAEAAERNIPLSYRDGPWLDQIIDASVEQPEFVRDWFFALANQGQ